MEKCLRLCFPTFQSAPQVLPEAGAGQRGDPPGVSALADGELVLEITETPCLTRDKSTNKFPRATTRGKPISSNGPETPATRLHSVGTVYARRGLSEEVTEFLLHSWRTGTQKQYQCYLNKWLEFCHTNDIDCFMPTINEVLEFLLSCFQRGLGYSTINTVRSALSTIVMADGKPVGQHELVSRFMRSVFIRRPNLTRVRLTWDYNDVLEHMKTLHPAEELPICQLTKKLVTLMAILSGVRGQILYLMNTKFMDLQTDYVIFDIPELTKTDKPGSKMYQVRFDAYPYDRSLCVVHYLFVYLERTLSVRWGDKFVFLTYGKTGEMQSRASRDTISRWITDMLKSAGVDTEVHTSHSTRTASTSGAVNTVSLQAIMRAAGWKRESTFQRFYNKPVEKKSCSLQAGLLKKNRKHKKN